MEPLEEADESPFAERFIRLICQFSYILYIALVLELMLLAFATLSALFADLDRGTEVVLLLDFVLLGIAIIPTAGGIVVCTRRP